MKRILFIICTLLLVSSLTVYAQDNAQIARALVKQAQTALNMGNYRKAEEKANEALKYSKSNSEALQIKAKCNAEFNRQKAEQERKIREQERIAEEKRLEAQRKREEAEQREREAYNSARDSESSDEMRSFLDKYPKSQYRQDMENRIADLGLWKKAKSTGTKEAYSQYLKNTQFGFYMREAENNIEEFIKKDKQEFESANTEETYQRYLRNFPDGNYKAEAQERIREIQLWNSARDLNTKAAYQDYLSKSTIKSHDKEANDAIRKKESEEEWARIKDSNYRSDFERFVSNYPASVHRSEAEWHINLLKGEESYNPGMDSQSYDDQALSYLNAANNYRRLTGEPAEHLQKLQAKKKHREMMRSKDESMVRSYLNSLSPANEYYKQTSNHLAVLIADRLSHSYNLKDDYKLAKTYAFSRETEEYVYSRYKSAKTLKKNLRKGEKRAIKSYRQNTRSYSSFNLGEWLGEHAQIGLDTSLDYAIKSKTDEDVEDPGVNQVGIGLMGRFGRSTDVLNVFVGVRYWIISTPDSFEDGIDDQKYETDEWNYKGYLAFPLKIRCNLIRTDGHGSFFIGGGAEFGLCMNKMLETSPFDKNFFSLSPQIGWTNKHFELSVYYKSYLQGPFKKEWVDNYKTQLDRKSVIGINVGYYF